MDKDAASQKFFEKQRQEHDKLHFPHLYTNKQNNFIQISHLIFYNKSQSIMIHKLKRIIQASVAYQSRFVFSAEIKGQLNKMKKNKIVPKTQIISLNSTEMNQLAKLTHYDTSIRYLQKNQLDEAEKYLVYSITQCKSNFPESVSLIMCLMNRLAILQKLQRKNSQLIENLQQIFFMCLSLRGEKSLETAKHLKNYLITLIMDDLVRARDVVDFVQEKFPFLLKKNYDAAGIIFSLSGQHLKGQQLITNAINTGLGSKTANINNKGWLEIMNQTNNTLEPLLIKDEKAIQIALQNFIESLCQEEKIADKSDEKREEIGKNLILIQSLQKLKGLNVNTQMQQIKRADATVKLFSMNSHIIAMNIAHALFFKRKIDLAAIFTQISVSAGIQFCQPQRIGLALILLSKINFIAKNSWENVLMDILNNQQVYSLGVLKECLTNYTRFLIAEKRFFEGEDFFHQGNKIKSNVAIQGLILPDYDFSY